MLAGAAVRSHADVFSRVASSTVSLTMDVDDAEEATLPVATTLWIVPAGDDGAQLLPRGVRR